MTAIEPLTFSQILKQNQIETDTSGVKEDPADLHTINKYNDIHDKLGRFASKNGGGAARFPTANKCESRLWKPQDIDNVREMANGVVEAIEDKGGYYESYGLRVQERDTEKVGKEITHTSTNKDVDLNGYGYEELGAPKDIDGVSTVGIGLKSNDAYSGKVVYLVGGSDGGDGVDIGEKVIKNPVVLAKYGYKDGNLTEIDSITHPRHSNDNQKNEAKPKASVDPKQAYWDYMDELRAKYGGKVGWKSEMTASEKEKEKQLWDVMIGKSASLVGKTENPQQFNIQKTDEDKRLVFGWANIAITADGEQIEDLQHDIIDPEELERAVYEYVLNFRDTGEEHIATKRLKGKLIESVMFTKEKMQAMGIPEGIVPEGWWVGFYIKDDEAWRLIKNGTYQMFSIEGTAMREPVEDDIIGKADRINGCGVLVVRDGKILTGTRIDGKHSNQICGPGGHLEYGETTEEAAIREAYEEFGIECKELEPLGILDGGRNYGKSAIFLCTEYDGEPQTDEEEMTDVQWRTIEELDEERLFWPFEQSLSLLKEDTAKSFDEILKYNDMHDELGRFASKGGNPAMGTAEAISQYQNYAYQSVNDGLRAGKVEGGANDIVEAMDKAFEEAPPTKYDQTLHRADGAATTAEIWEKNGTTAKLPPHGDLADIWLDSASRQTIKDSLIGETFTDKGFMSTSKDREKAQEFAYGNPYSPYGVEAMVHISVPKGTKVIDLGDDGFITGSGEQETILNRGSSYKISAVEFNYETQGLDIYADLVTNTAKSFTEAIAKFNPFHDSNGRFSNKNGFASYSANPKTKAGAMAISRSAQAGHGTTMNVHRESMGENINQNYAWMQGGPGAKALAAQGQLASQQPKPQAKPQTPPKPQKNYDSKGFADQDDADYHQLYNGRQYYQQQQLSATTKQACNRYLDPNTEAGSLYNFSQNMNQAVAKGTINSPRNAKYKAVYDELLSNMHNLGYNVNLTRYDHGGFLDDQLKQVGITNRKGMSVQQMKQALVGHSYGDNRILSTSYNDFKNANNHSTFSTREVKIVYRAKANTQVLMPGDGPGGKFGEMLLAPTGTGGSNKYTIVDVRNTGNRARAKGSSPYNLNLNQIEVIVEVG